ncbi:S9 family peptidase [Actinokineospora diospyrosa]|uniref:Dipeptidyl aminopeptidase/acylaminoacyl peptidase n=1 Tax=Actinokineospora diospyrosa TaxID=103728 RepID=A0ABT1I6P0_9PSEU|nr:S9 family peptidase [Actinokineospora diospyrosa]MCP2268304.1 Dipeptidyl aminopeptidase/acylaminoacyl peptidase [Actinokineospora diospyrosa]
MRPEDIELAAAPGAPALRGDLLLVGLATPDLSTNSYPGGLYRVGLAGGAVREFTRGHRDWAPAISPDGSQVAFLRSAKAGSPAQLHVIPVDGGEARQLTDLPLGVGAPVWAPDSRRIAFVARVPEPGRYGVAVGDQPPGTAPDAAAEAPRVITRLEYRFDDIGFLGDRPLQLFTVDINTADIGAVSINTADFGAADTDAVGAGAANTANARQLTEGYGTPEHPTWTPDGAHVLVRARRDWGVVDTLNTDLYAIPADGGAPVLVARSAGTVEHPVALADGTVAFLGDDFPDTHCVARNVGLWTVPLVLDGAPGRPHRLTDPETVDAEIAAGRPVVTDSGLLVAVRNRGAVELRRVPLGADGAALAELPLVAGEQAAVKGFAADGDRIVCTVSTWDAPGEVVLVEDETTRRLTDFSARLRARGLRQPIEVKGVAPDGYATHGWVVLPEGEGPHPVLLSVHGGPFMYHGWGFYDEAQVYAAAGYAVVLPNPRGSAGYGEAHGRSIIGAMGTVDVDDVLSVLDAALERPDVDPADVGVMGGSYGGWMAGWLAAHHGHRFRAAWSERAVNSWESFVGTSDIGWWFAEAYCGTDPAQLLARSPLTHAHRITLPFAVVHSEHDWRCPVEQAQRMYVALRRNGVDAELILFPGEGHELTRSGKPRHREQRFREVLRWWSRHL